MEIMANGKLYNVKDEPDRPLIWVLRDELGLTGTKFGCGVGICGVCDVHVDGKVVRSCITPLSTVKGKSIRTIEGLASEGICIQCSRRFWTSRCISAAGA